MHSESLKAFKQIIKEGYRKWEKYLFQKYALNEPLKWDSHTAIAPAGQLARKAIQKLLRRGNCPAALCDHNPKLWGTSIEGVMVMPYEEFANKHLNGTLCVASAMYDSEIRELGEKCGIPKIIGYPLLAKREPELFGVREYFEITKSVFLPGAARAIEKLYHILQDKKSRNVLLSKVLYYLNIEKSLLDKIKSKNEIYWDSSILKIQSDEIVVDAGAYRGDTLQSFLRVVKEKKFKYYAFEPNPFLQKELRKIASNTTGAVVCEECGLSDKKGFVPFFVSGSLDTKIVRKKKQASENIASLKVTDLDSYFEGRQPPTFIKMDIEGEERRALGGAGHLIKKHKPTLAISVYHHPSDLWEIPLLIKKLNPKSKILLRHYSREIDDTVCYSVSPNN